MKAELKDKPVLAIYDIRAKQDFIYRSQHLKEIIGGSAIIRDLFDDYLYDAAKEIRDKKFDSQNDPAIYNYSVSNPEAPFSYTEFENRMTGRQYIGEVVYNGGGNFFILYKNGEICKDVTAAFTEKVLKEIGTLKVICTYTEAHRDDYKGDQKNLYTKHRYMENQESPIAPYGTLPIVQADPLTSMPLTHFYKTIKRQPAKALTKEAYAKYRKYDQIKNKDKNMIPNENILDALVTQKGEESLLAVIHIDGNNMGAKVAEYNKNTKTYDECVSNLRIFSKEIQEIFIDDRLEQIDEAAKSHSRKSDMDGVRRLIVGSGDDFTIITNARAALPVAVAYLKELKKVKKNDGSPFDWSSCAGISIFHSHTPFADAYRIAEECCETGKQYMKEKAVNPQNTDWADACMLDFHFNQGVIGISLDNIRETEESADISIPWLISEQTTDEQDITYDDVKKMQALLNLFGRSNTKGLLKAAKKSADSLHMEISRIRAHMSDEKTSEFDSMKSFLYQKTSDGEKIREKALGLIIRMIPVYDIWFAKEES